MSTATTTFPSNVTVRKDAALLPLWPIGDSITYGVWAQTLAGYREPLYTLAHPSANLYLVGSQSFAGNAGGLANDPWCEAYPGICIRVGSGGGSLITTLAGAAAVQVQLPFGAVILAGTNDIAQGDTSATVLTSMSTFLDQVWSYRTGAKFQILLCQILKRLDAFDPTVQTVNAGLPALVAGKSYASNVVQVPMYAAVANPTIYDASTNPTGGYHDVVHPVDTGYTNMATVLWPYVQQAITAWESP